MMSKFRNSLANSVLAGKKDSEDSIAGSKVASCLPMEARSTTLPLKRCGSRVADGSNVWQVMRNGRAAGTGRR